MKKTKTGEVMLPVESDLRPEYEFDYKAARPNRFAQRIENERLVVTLDPDVSQVFSTSESVNCALRALIGVISQVPKPSRISK